MSALLINLHDLVSTMYSVGLYNIHRLPSASCYIVTILILIFRIRFLFDTTLDYRLQENSRCRHLTVNSHRALVTDICLGDIQYAVSKKLSSEAMLYRDKLLRDESCSW